LITALVSCEAATPTAATHTPLSTETAALPPSPTPSPIPSPAYSIPIRGIRVDIGRGFENDPAFVATLREMNVNWVELVLWPQVTTDGKIFECWTGSNMPDPPSVEELERTCAQTEPIMVDTIYKWHELGFRVFLVVYHERFANHHAYGDGITGSTQEILRQAGEIAARWAEIAERTGVEMYAPRKELQAFVGQKAALRWDDEILPALRSAYHGDLVRGALADFTLWDTEAKCGWQGEELPSSFAGWDYIGVDFYGSQTDTFEDLAAMYALFVEKVRELKIRDNVKGVVFEELGIPHNGTETYWKDPSLSGDEIMNRLYQIYFTGGAGGIEGFFPWVWEERDYDLPGGRYEHITPVNIIGQYYTASTIPPYTGPVAEECQPSDVGYEIGRTILQDNFDDSSHWNLSNNASISNGFLEFRGPGSAEIKEALSENWRDYTVSGRFMITEGTPLTFRVRSTGEWWSGDNYQAIISPISMISLIRPWQDGIVCVRFTRFLVEYNEWYTFKIVVKNNSVQLFIHDEKVLEYLDPSPLPEGVFVISSDGEGSKAFVDEVLVQEIR